jgi:transcriptional regulator GlxA family with amidase domain
VVEPGTEYTCSQPVDPAARAGDEGDRATGAVAARVARDLVMPLHRDGGQAQYIETPVPAGDTELFTATLGWLREHLDEQVSVRELAARSAMSPRSFARKFVASTGITPYRWLLRERLALARRLLETGDLPVEAIARASGLQTAGNLRKHFARELRTTPHAYRRAFKVPS